MKTSKNMIYKAKNYSLILCSLLIISCAQKEGELFFNPDPQETGITFTNTITNTNELSILDYLYFYNGGGVAIGDIDNDGLVDIFFSGNQVKNKLYRNKGNLQFEDITEQAGVAGNSTWNTGAVMGDINGDGLLDIYVCAVVGINGFEGHNELYINHGNGNFTESAAAYGLDHDSYSSSAAFLDYDLDGDLDIYLLNHAVHTQESFGKVDLRFTRNFQTGDKLMRNDNGKFTEVSEEAGIFGGINGYGLGIAIADFNRDGYPDIYVGNDFHEDDYYYLNNGNGTFTERIKEFFGHTSRFSMGNDVADINHDGWPDIISLDMLPKDEKVLKSSEGDDNVQTQKLRTQGFGYHYQFTRNMLYINQSNGGYTETALLSGVAATDWSWSALFADYNQDGEQDLFISNGIPKRPNNLDFINFTSNEQIQKKINNTKLVDQQALNLMPSGNVPNYVFKGGTNLRFQDVSKKWIRQDTLISGASAIGDLDNDGDLDIVTNNINSPASIYINKTNEKANYLKIKLRYNQKNPFGLGTKVSSYRNGQLQYKELYTVRGFQSSSEPIIHFGYGKATTVDSIQIIWPNSEYQVLKNITLNQTLIITPLNTKPYNGIFAKTKAKPLFEKVTNNIGIDFTHVEDNYDDFNRQKLIPYRVSDRGPALAIGDINNDGKEDIFFGGSRNKASKIYVQTDSAYVGQKYNAIAKDSLKEDVVALIADLDSNGEKDLFIGSGGADFFNTMQPLIDNYYLQKDSVYIGHELKGYFHNASVIKGHDFDADGDLDLFLGSNSISNDFGKIPTSYLFENDKGIFKRKENKELENAGMITDAIWNDFDNDGIKDLIVIGEWMSPKFFKNTIHGELTEITVLEEDLQGLWQSIIPFDIDEDGDTDYLLGNWGENTKFRASKQYPMRMYYADFDENGSTETIVTTAKNGTYYPLEGLNELSEQLIQLRKKFTSYKEFAGKSITQILDKESRDNAVILEVNELRSGYLKNNGGYFSFVPFKMELQVAPIKAFLRYDFDKDGKEEVLVGGNYFGVRPFHGRFDTFTGALIKNNKNVLLGSEIGLDLYQKSVRNLSIITLQNKAYLLITLNNDSAQVYRMFN